MHPQVILTIPSALSSAWSFSPLPTKKRCRDGPSLVRCLKTKSQVGNCQILDLIIDFPGELFRIVKEKEENQYGEYRTKRLV
jgi:hypothetical protein